MPNVEDVDQTPFIAPFIERLTKVYSSQYVLGEVEREFITNMGECEYNIARYRVLIKRDGETTITSKGGMTLSPWKRQEDKWIERNNRLIAKFESHLRRRSSARRTTVVESEFTPLLTIDRTTIDDASFASVFVKRAEDYVRDVLSGKIDASLEVRQACQRHVDDLRKSAAGDEFPYKYSKYMAHRAADFISHLPHIKGRWARDRQLITLEPWQCFLVCSLFGWIKKETNLRRFSETYWEIPRKNGKSMLAAAIGLFMLCADEEFGAEIYSGATSEKQAWEVFMPARMMVLNAYGLKEAAGLVIKARSITRPTDGAKFEPVIGKPGDGSSPSCAIADEVHEHLTSDLIDTMVTGMGAREQPIMLMITTAGYDLASPCYEHRKAAKLTLSDVAKNEALFAIIYTIDLKTEGAGEKDDKDKKGDDWTDPKVLKKANPNLGVSIDREKLESQQRSAIITASEQNRFKTKYLNVWCSARAAWLSTSAWQALGDKQLVADDLKGTECVFAFDLASKLDFAAWVMVFCQVIGNKNHYYVFGRYYLPEARFEEKTRHSHIFNAWERRGLITKTDGATTDFRLIKDDILAATKLFNPREVVYDPYNATQLASDLIDEKIQMVEFTQKPHNFAVPMDEVEGAVKEGRLHHDGDEVMTWMINNVALRPTNKGLFAPTRNSKEEKIDGPVTIMMAVDRFIGAPPKAAAKPRLVFV